MADEEVEGHEMELSALNKLQLDMLVFRLLGHGPDPVAKRETFEAPRLK